MVLVLVVVPVDDRGDDCKSKKRRRWELPSRRQGLGEETWETPAAAAAAAILPAPLAILAVSSYYQRQTPIPSGSF